MQVKDLKALLNTAREDATVFVVKFVEGENEPKLRPCSALIHNNTGRVEIFELTQGK